MKPATTIYCCAAILSTVWFAQAMVVRVPQDSPSIQAAFDTIGNNDTVMVSLGTYTEELHAPSMRFWLIGDVEIDTGEFARPVIDPSTLDSARWRKCLDIPAGCELTVERMAFVNRAAMYPRAGALVTGGIQVNSLLPLTFRYCTFDSVYRAIVHDEPGHFPVHYVVANCRFVNAPRIQIRAEQPGRAEIRQCLFHGRHCVSELVLGGDGTSLEQCSFSGDSVAGAITLQASNLIIRDCIFGPVDSCADPLIRIYSNSRTIIEGNVFHDISLTADKLGYMEYDSGEAVIIRNNSFLGIAVEAATASTELTINHSELAPPGVCAEIDSNVFLYSSTGHLSYRSRALGVSASLTVTGSHFFSLRPDSTPWIVVTPSAFVTCPLRRCWFQSPDYAIHSLSNSVDAVLNFWGDPSGPYNSEHNPAGRGARVDDPVLFDPWSPDTNFFNPVETRPAFPTRFSLSAFPNPFNAVVTLRLIPSEVTIVRVELFDILGRHIKEIWSGALAYERRIVFDGSNLASGIYFVRVWETVGNRPLAITKLVLLK